MDPTRIGKFLLTNMFIVGNLSKMDLGKIIKDKYPELDDEDRESVRQHAVAALNIIQQTKQLTNASDGCFLAELHRSVKL